MTLLNIWLHSCLTDTLAQGISLYAIALQLNWIEHFVTILNNCCATSYEFRWRKLLEGAEIERPKTCSIETFHWLTIADYRSIDSDNAPIIARAIASNTSFGINSPMWKLATSLLIEHLPPETLVLISYEQAQFMSSTFVHLSILREQFRVRASSNACSTVIFSPPNRQPMV